jgi:hypothetical protein
MKFHSSFFSGQPGCDGNSLIWHQNDGLLPGIFTKTIINGVPDAGKSM